MNAVPIVGASGPAVVWYLARASGITALVLLTLTVVGGILASVRWSSAQWPRFVTQLVHRNVSLLAVVMIGVHVVTIVVDGFAPIGWLDVFVPFTSGYRPIWLGLGAIGFDLVLAIVVTSLLRYRIGQRTWRFVHWFAYACWPIVVIHGLATGSDTKSKLVLATNVVCILLVVFAVWWRIATSGPEHRRVRLVALATTIAAPFLLVVWLVSGPLADGWARAAGTPDSLLASGTAIAARTPVTTTPTAAAQAFPAMPFSARVDGTLATSSPDANGRVAVRLALRVSDGATGVLDITLQGRPTQGGGVAMDASRVRLGTAAQPGLYDGSVTDLQGDLVVASLRSASAPPMQLTVSVQIDNRNQVRGQLSTQRATVAASGTSGGERSGA